MSTPAAPARIHLLPAKEAPYVVIIRRKPSRWFHIIRWNTQTDEVEHGSWYYGTLHPERCDVSFDGEWMVYAAAKYQYGQCDWWNGICRPPFLKTEAQISENGGGYWRDRNTLVMSTYPDLEGTVPFTVEQSELRGRDLIILSERMKRDGWKYNSENLWSYQPSGGRPELQAKPRGNQGDTFYYSLPEYPELLDENVDSATWDCLGNLIFSKNGIVYRYSSDDLAANAPGFTLDLEPLTPRST